VAPIIASNQKIADRLTLASELKLGLSVYSPSSATSQYLKEAPVHEIALNLPNLLLPKTRLDDFTGDIGESVKCDFSHESLRVAGEPLSL